MREFNKGEKTAAEKKPQINFAVSGETLELMEK